MRRALVVTAAAGALVGLAGAPARAGFVLSGLDSNPSLGGNPLDLLPYADPARG